MSMPLKLNIHRMLVVLPVLLLVLSLGAAIWYGMQVQPLPVAQDLVLPATLTRLPDEDGRSSLIRSVLKNGEEIRNDPFAAGDGTGEPSTAANVTDAELVDIQLNMVARGGGVRLCLINGMLMREGESASGFTVKQVLSRGVKLQCGEEEFLLLPGQKAVLVGGRLSEIIEVQEQERATAPVQSSEPPSE